jgi:hypothetical protein
LRRFNSKKPRKPVGRKSPKEFSIAATHLEDRTTLFDPKAPDRLIGYNPLRPISGLAVANHAERIWEAIRTAWGEATFQQTPQLARWLLNALYVVRSAEATLLDILGVLDFEDSSARQTLLQKVNHPEVLREWERFEVLPARRREEMLASTLARLHAFCMNPIIRQILSPKDYSLDLQSIMAEGGILLVNLRRYNPLAEEHVRLLGSLLVQDIIAHVFSRPEGARRPVFLICDEFQNFVSGSGQFNKVLDEGRSFGLFLTLAHQHLAQLKEEDPKLFASVMTNCQTKIIFGSCSNSDLKLLTEELTIGDFDPRTIKDEFTTLELDPIETTRITRSRNSTHEASQSQSRSFSEETNWSEQESESQETNWAEQESQSQEENWAEQISENESLSTALSLSATRGHSRSKGESYAESGSQAKGHGRSRGKSRGSGSYEGEGEVLTPPPDFTLVVGENGEVINQNLNSGTSLSRADSEGSNDFEITATGESHGDISIDTESESETEGLTIAHTRGVSRGSNRGGSVGVSRGRSQGGSVGLSRASSQGVSSGVTEGVQSGTSDAHTTGESIAPFYEYRKRRNVTSRTYVSFEEFIITQLQRLKGMLKTHFAIKIPHHSLVFLQAPYATPLALAPGRLEECFKKITSKPYYIDLPSADRLALRVSLPAGQDRKTEAQPLIDTWE